MRQGGGTPAGQTSLLFQIWINVPRSRKGDDPKYGVAQPHELPVFTTDCTLGRVLAGTVRGLTGPFTTAKSVQIVDYNLQPGATVTHQLPATYDTCLVYVYEGSGDVGGK